MVDLTTLLGSSFYTLDSPFAILEKWMRDLIVLPIGHAGTVSCLLALIPNLPAWERRTRTPTKFDPKLFGLDDLSEELDFGRLRVGVGSGDSLVASLTAPHVLTAFRSAFPEYASDLDGWIDELTSVQLACRVLRPRDLGADPPADVASVAARLTHLMAAGALVGRWYATRSQTGSAFARSDGALRAAFARVSELMPGSEPAAHRFFWTDEVVTTATDQLRASVRGRRSLGIEETPVNWAGAAWPDEDTEETA